MLTLGVTDFVDGQIRGMIKQLRNQVGTYLVKEPGKESGTNLVDKLGATEA